MENYSISPKMIGGAVYCNEKSSVEDLKAMNIDRRWNEDNRVLTWTFGLINAAFDQKFIQNGMVINETDDKVLKIVDKNKEESEELKGYRHTRYNGNWLKVDHLL